MFPQRYDIVCVILTSFNDVHSFLHQVKRALPRPVARRPQRCGGQLRREALRRLLRVTGAAPRVTHQTLRHALAELRECQLGGETIVLEFYNSQTSAAVEQLRD